MDRVTLDNLRALRSSYRAAADRQRRLEAGAALPFAFSVHFADVAARGGFDVIVGNPPWVRIHNIGPSARQTLYREFSSFNRAAWREGAELAGSGHAFANQIDTASLFIERSIFLLREGGSVALLVPAKIWRSLSGGGVRDLIGKTLRLSALEDMTESRSGFDAAVYPSLVVGTRSGAQSDSFAATVHRSGSALQWRMPQESLALDNSTGSPWLLVPAEVRRSFDAITEVGKPLGHSPFGRPILGVKTGCNAAFILKSGDQDGVESSLLKPIVRGETTAAWSWKQTQERIIWTHADDGAALKSLPPGALRTLSRWRTKLERRTDARNASRWWTLFRTEGASSGQWRVVWGDFGKAPRAFVLPPGSEVVPLNTCYVVKAPNKVDALTLAALLNGPLLASWLDSIAEPARGGYRRYLGWTVSLMPLPRDWKRATEVMAPLAEEALAGRIPCQRELLTAAVAAYRLRSVNVEALVTWANRS